MGWYMLTLKGTCWKHTITNDSILNIECELHKYVNIIEYYI